MDFVAQGYLKMTILAANEAESWYDETCGGIN
jgi:hypothetical protein